LNETPLVSISNAISRECGDLDGHCQSFWN
jgi:hypothetical protein